MIEMKATIDDDVPNGISTLAKNDLTYTFKLEKSCKVQKNEYKIH